MHHYLFVETGLGYLYIMIALVTGFIAGGNALFEEGDTAKWGARVFFLSPVWFVFPVWGLLWLLRYLLRTAGWWPTKKETAT